MSGVPANSVVERILANASRCPGTPFLTLIGRDGAEASLSYAALVERAGRWAERFRDAGLSAGEVVIVILEHGEALYAAYLGALLAGCRPAYFAHPSEKVHESRYRESVRLLLETVGAGALVTSRATHARSEATVPGTATLLDDGELASARAGRSPTRVPPDALFLQFSSGTTGIKKGVPITADMLTWQVEAYARRIAVGPGDRIASWLPLYHDMGLIACLFLPLLERVPLVAMSPFDWVRRPEMLLDAITRHRATLVWLPNFAYNFLAARVAEPHAGRWDLSSLRAVVNCSEPIQAKSHRLLVERFAASGLKEAALATCYAMAESTFAVTSGGIDTALVAETVDAATLAPGRLVERVTPDAKRAWTVVGSGQPLDEARVAIVDAAGHPLPEGSVGEIEVACPSLFGGYVADAGAGPQSGCFRTGDLGYLRGAELFVIGRSKDTIIVGGRNIHPQDVEAIVNGVEGVIPGRCVAVGVEDPQLGTQSLVVLAETRLTDLAARAELRRRAREAVASALDVIPGDVALADHLSLHKSTSGKLARGANRDRYLAVARAAAEPGEAAPQPLPSLEAVRGCVIATASRDATRWTPDFDADTDLVREGILDSFSLVAFHLALEERFGAKAVHAVRELPERFRTVRAIAEAVTREPGATEEPQPPAGAPPRAGAPRQSLKYELAPQMRDVEAQPYEWVAYLMRRGMPNYRSRSLNSDEHGFRATYRGGTVLGYGEFAARREPKAVVLGNSCAYGIGTTHDARTLTSRLNELDSTGRFVWYNLAQRASVLMQERLGFELYAPPDVVCVVWLSGINNLISLIVGEGHPGNPAPFVGERQYAARMMPGVRLPPPPTLERRYAEMVRQIEVDLSALALRLRGTGRILFCLQPSASWIDKRWTGEERALIEVFDAAGAALQQAHHPQVLGPLHERYARDVAAICRRWEIDFIDSNLDPALGAGRWLFLDRTHLTDEGQQALAALVARWLASLRDAAKPKAEPAPGWALLRSLGRRR
jgi:fatty-acyl-CoA synthase